ncbi:unnamed protein product, partial [Ixodes hexagonus]
THNRLQNLRSCCLAAATMRTALVTAMAVTLLLLLCVTHTEATKHLIFAPFIWAGNLVKDATQGLVAYKLSIATKLLAMITGNRSFRASIQYDSRLEKYQQPPAATGGLFHKVPEVVPKPHPVAIEHDVKVNWLPGVKMPHLHMPHLHMPHIQLPHPHMPSLPKFELPKLPMPDFSHFSKFHKIPQLPSVAGILHAPKFASGYVSGGFKIGHGGGPGNQVLGGPGTQVLSRSFNIPSQGPLGNAAPLSDGSSDAQDPLAVAQKLLKVASSNGTRNITKTVAELSQQLIDQANSTNSTSSLSQGLSRRSTSNPSLAAYFSFIQSNDEGECIAKMVCSMAAQPQEYGVYGAKVLEFFEAMEPSRPSPAYAYKEAISRGHNGTDCRKLYTSCKVDPKHLAQIGSSEL